MTTETRYFTSTATTVNGLSGYALALSQTATSQYISAAGANNSGSQTAYFYVRVGKVASDGVQTIILDWTLHSERSASGSGIVSTDITIPSTSLATTDAIFVIVKVQLEDGTNATATFVTEVLNATSVSGTWTFALYTYRSYSTGAKATTARFYWDTSTYLSRIDNFYWSATTSVSNILTSVYEIRQKVTGYSDIASIAKIEAQNFMDYFTKLKLASIIWYKREVSPSYGTVGYATVTVETIFSDVQAPDPRQISVVFNLRSQLDSSTTLSTTVGVYSLATKVFQAIGSIPIPTNVPLNCYDLEIEVNYLVT